MGQDQDWGQGGYHDGAYHDHDGREPGYLGVVWMDGLINTRCSPRHRALLQRASPRPQRRPPAGGGACGLGVGAGPPTLG